MKKTYLLMLALIMGTLIVSCTTQKEEKKVVLSSNTPEQGEIEPPQITPEKAYPMIKAYRPRQSKLMKSSDMTVAEVPQFIHVPHNELQSMLNALGNNPAQLYATMVVDEGNTAIVFAGKKTKISEWAYFDFTEPCPPACDTVGIAGSN